MERLSIREKIAYAIGGSATDMAWRVVSAFLFIFYTDIYGLTPASVGLLLLIGNFCGGASDIAMGIIGDRTRTRWGKFRPWLIWSALPLGIIISLLFTNPEWSTESKIVYAYVTYILFSLIFAANNISYSALMGIMTSDEKERTSISSYRMVGAFAGGLLVQGVLLSVVIYFGSINPSVIVYQHSNNSFEVCVSSNDDIQTAEINTTEGIAKFQWLNIVPADNQISSSKKFDMIKGESYIFSVENDTILGTDSLRFITSDGEAIKPSIIMEHEYGHKYKVCVSPITDARDVTFSTTSVNGAIKWDYRTIDKDVLTIGKNFTMRKGETYTFLVSGIPTISTNDIIVVNQQKGYSNTIYILSALIVLLMIATFFFTKERRATSETQYSSLLNDLKDIVQNRPLIILLIVGLIFTMYNSIKQGITVIYFTHYINNQALAGIYLITLLIASIIGAMVTASLSRLVGKKRLFIYALIFTGVINALLALCGSSDTIAIFTIGIISEIAAAILPTLFYTMLGDTVDYTELKTGHRITGLIYSFGSVATKIGVGIAALAVGGILSWFGYNGQDAVAIEGATQGIIMLMSWIPAIIIVLGAIVMHFYPLNSNSQEWK